MPNSEFWCNRYHEGGRLSDEQMALLQYQRENLHFLSEEVFDDLKFTIGIAPIALHFISNSSLCQH